MESFSDFTYTLYFTFYAPKISAFFKGFGLCFEMNTSICKRGTCLQATEKTWLVRLLQDCLNFPWRHVHFSTDNEGSLAEGPEFLFD